MDLDNFNYSQPYVSVVGIAKKNGKFLMVKEGDEPDKGKWNLPAGKWDSGETLIEAVVREFGEETGCSFTPTCVVAVNTVFKEPNATLARIVFAGSVKGEICVDGCEIEEAKWFSIEDILNMNKNELRVMSNKKLLTDYLDGKTYPLSLICHFDQRNMI